VTDYRKPSLSKGLTRCSVALPSPSDWLMRCHKRQRGFPQLWSRAPYFGNVRFTGIKPAKFIFIHLELHDTEHIHIELQTTTVTPEMRRYCSTERSTRNAFWARANTYCIRLIPPTRRRTAADEIAALLSQMERIGLFS
jgi:hypothetical protein